MKKLFLAVAVVAMLFGTTTSFAAKKQAKPKYVFFLIGDGMGLASMYTAQKYLMQKGSESLQMAQLPYSGIIYTYSSDSEVTDSAAAGTALSSATKTSNGTIGMKANHVDTVESMAYVAKKNGRAVGILTSVSIDHATPAAFYAHQPSRKMAYEIAMDGVDTGFDMFVGSGFVEPVSQKDGSQIEVHAAYKDAGYTIISGKSEMNKLNSANKVVITERKGASLDAFAYAIDKCDKDLQIDEVTKEAIPYLKTRGGKKGFFMMVEGGKIDWANHSNDLATSMLEVFSFDRVIQEAYEFYLAHPNETLIVITADHDTGAQCIVRDHASINLGVVDHQKISQEKLEKVVVEMQNSGKSWEDMKSFLSENLGLWSKIEVSIDDEYYMHKAFLAKDKTKAHYDELGGRLAGHAISLVNRASGVEWMTHDHSAIPVPVYSIGVGAEEFSGVMENSELSQKLINTLK